LPYQIPSDYAPAHKAAVISSVCPKDAPATPYGIERKVYCTQYNSFLARKKKEAILA